MNKRGETKIEVDISKVLKDIRKKLDKGEINEVQAQVLEQRAPVEQVLELKPKDKERARSKEKLKNYILTKIPGLDELFGKGIPEKSSILIAGGAGSGKTILSLQLVYNHAMEGKKCLYISFEEAESKLLDHMDSFGWNAEKLVKKDMLRIIRGSPFDITRNIDALLAKQKGELLIDIEPVIIPEDFRPDIVIIDSLTAIASTFVGREENYRIYIEQLFRFLEKSGATSFLITETEEVPKIFSPTGVEEFLADGVIVLYNISHGNIRENAIEVLKLRGASHQKRIVAMQITEKGIVVYPSQEIFADIK